MEPRNLFEEGDPALGSSGRLLTRHVEALRPANVAALGLEAHRVLQDLAAAELLGDTESPKQVFLEKFLGKRLR